MKRAKSLRWQNFILMAAIAIVECIVLGMTVSFSGVFTELDAEAFRFFENDAAERANSVNNRATQLIVNLANEVEGFSKNAQTIAAEAGISFEQAYLDDDLFNEIATYGTEQLLQFLSGNPVSSAFL